MDNDEPTRDPVAQLINEELDRQGLSYRIAAERSGGLITHATLNYFANGRSTFRRVQPDTVRGIALALDLPVSRVQKAFNDAAGMPDLPTFKLPKKADKLSEKQRKAVLAFVNALLEDK